MPELPEVETIRRQLEKHLPLKVEKTHHSKGFTKNILKTKTIDLKGKTIKAIKRHGKVLIFECTDGTCFLSHLGMTGTWLIGSELKLGSHAHFVIQSHHITLAYDDPRRFGKMYFYKPNENYNKIDELGYDLLDSRIDSEYIKSVCSRFPQKPIKVLLLDQRFFAGSGNYIANEICARAGILPYRQCKSLTTTELRNIVKAISAVLKPALKSGGTTFQGGYRDTSGEKGKGIDHLVVFYQKTCKLCNITPVKKSLLAGRGTYYCMHCQK